MSDEKKEPGFGDFLRSVIPTNKEIKERIVTRLPSVTPSLGLTPGPQVPSPPPSAFSPVPIPLDQYKKQVGDFFNGVGTRVAPTVKGAAETLDRANAIGSAITPGAGIGVAVQQLMKPAAPTAPGAPVPTSAPAPGTTPGSEEPVQVVPEPAVVTSGGGPVTVGAAEQPLVAPERQQALQAAFQRQKDAIRGTQEAEGRVGDALANEDLSRAAGAKALGDKQLENQQDVKARAEARSAKLQAMQADIQAMSADVNARSKEDPMRFWRDKSGFQKLGYGLALALGTAGSSLLGRSNDVLNMINREVDQDIESQRKDYEHDRDAVNDKKNLYAMAYQVTGDEDEAMKVARGFGLEVVKNQIDQIAYGTKSQTALANADLIKSRLGVTASEVDVAAENTGIKMNQFVPAHTVGGKGDEGIDWKEQRQISEDLAKEKVPAAEAAYGQVQDLLKDPRTQMGYLDRAAMMATQSENEHVRQIAIAKLNPQQRQLASALYALSLAEAGEEGVRNAQIINHNYEKNVGTASREDILNGAANSHSIIIGRASESKAGHKPSQVKIHHVLRATSEESPLTRPRPKAPTVEGFKESR